MKLTLKPFKKGIQKCLFGSSGSKATTYYYKDQPPGTKATSPGSGRSAAAAAAAAATKGATFCDEDETIASSASLNNIVSSPSFTAKKQAIIGRLQSPPPPPETPAFVDYGYEVATPERGNANDGYEHEHDATTNLTRADNNIDYTEGRAHSYPSPEVDESSACSPAAGTCMNAPETQSLRSSLKTTSSYQDGKTSEYDFIPKQQAKVVRRRRSMGSIIDHNQEVEQQLNTKSKHQQKSSLSSPGSPSRKRPSKERARRRRSSSLGHVTVAQNDDDDVPPKQQQQQLRRQQQKEPAPRSPFRRPKSPSAHQQSVPLRSSSRGPKSPTKSPATNKRKKTKKRRSSCGGSIQRSHMAETSLKPTIPTAASSAQQPPPPQPQEQPGQQRPVGERTDKNVTKREMDAAALQMKALDDMLAGKRPIPKKQQQAPF